MSDKNHPARRLVRNNVEKLAESSDDKVEFAEADPDEMRLLEEQLEELRSEGILSGVPEPRRRMEPVAHRPGALERFMADRD